MASLGYVMDGWLRSRRLMLPPGVAGLGCRVLRSHPLAPSGSILAGRWAFCLAW